MVNKITESTAEEGEESPIQWTRLSSKEELDQAMSNNELYGAMVIPRDFSQRQYDALVQTMQDQIDEMQANVTDSLSFGSSASDGLSLPSMSAGAGAMAGGTPQLSAEAQKMISAAQAAVAGATKNAQGAAANFQKDQAGARSVAKAARGSEGASRTAAGEHPDFEGRTREARNRIGDA